jgi:hypothetical protein
MRLVVRRLRIEDVEKLQALVVENFDAIEPGLTVLDARLLLGHSTIDVVGVDAAGSLVLGAVGFTADEEMLLKAVEAYSWCIEYSESLARHYPSCHISEDRPPRLLFVVERVPDAFHRKIKQLGFPEVDCVEVRHLEFDGVPAVYFETLLRLRRGAAPAAARAVEPAAAPGAPAPIPAGDSPVAPVVPARGTGVKVPRLLGQGGTDAPTAGPRASERPVLSREPAPVVSMVSRQASAAVRVERPRPAAEPLTLAEPEPLVLESAAAPVPAASPVVEPAPVPLPTVAPGAPVDARVSFKELASALLGAESASPAVAPVVETPVAAVVPAPPVIEPPAAPVEPAPKLELKPEPPVVAATPAPASDAVVEPAPALTVEALVAASAPATAPASPPPPADPAKQLLTALPQEFEGLKFPNDGVLTRQWMEFLNQMSSTK